MIIQPIIKTGGGTVQRWAVDPQWGWSDAAALIGNSDNGFVGVFAVYPGINNYVSIKCVLTGLTAGTIYWGDGTTESLASGTQHNKILLYDDIAASATTYGYKVAVIRVITTSTSLNSVELSLKHPNEKTINTTNWLALKIRSQYTGVFTYTHRTDKRARMLEVLDFGTTLAVSPFLLCDNHQRLQQLIVKFAAQFGNQLFMGAGCQFLDLTDIDFSPITSAATSLFNGCMYSGTVEKSIPAITTLSNAFAYSNVNKVILTDTGLVTDIGSAIYDSDVEVFEMDDASAVTTASTFVAPYTNMRNKLKRMILPGLKIGMNLSYQQMSAAQINALGDSLGTANGSQTFTFTGNEGAATADSTKFTNKGFTYTY